MSTNLLISSNNDFLVCKEFDKILDIADEKCSIFMSNLYKSTGNSFILRKEKSIDNKGTVVITVWSRLANSITSYDSESFWCKIYQNVTDHSI